MVNQTCNGLIMYKGTGMGISYTPSNSFRGLSKKKEFYDDCSKNMKDIQSSIWSDKPQTESKLVKILKDIK